ncbi:acyltransferase family protein [Microbacterium sp. G2-8]|uniref:acyltransferase family protein n=1 Tax=Microbacterium sp. G2-8 TaxID=2842454 RepID=UPI001C895FC3|nr:acyltransferase family protein [Microbacterium sp. G2-8]
MTTPASPLSRLISPRSGAFRADVQALRALAVMSVLVYHLWPNRLPGGFVGVDVFFVISGYLITSHLLREREKTGRIALASFWARRAARLLPASLLVLAATAIAVIVWVPQSLWKQFLGEIAASALYVQNWRLMADSVDYLAAENTASPVQHFWTLSAEEQFYVLLPLLLVGSIWLFRRLSWRRVALAAVATATIASLVYGVVLTAQAPSQAYFSTFTRAWEFGAGALLAFVPQHGRVRLGSGVTVTGVVGILAAVMLFSGDMPFPGAAALLPVLGTAAVIWGGRVSPLEMLGRIAPVSFLGRVSYAIYLWHWPIIVILPFIVDMPLTTWHKIGIAAGSILLAWLSTTYVEDVVRSSPRLLARRRPRTIALWSAAGMACVLTITSLSFAALSSQEQSIDEVTAELVADPPDCFGAESMDPSVSLCENPELDALPLVPGLTDIESDDGNLVECWAQPDVTELNMCSFGPKAADIRIVAIGDSHNNAMIPTYRAAAEQLGWRIDVAGHAGCFWTDEDLSLATDEQTQACEEWRAQVGHYVQSADDVDAYIVASRAGEEDASQARVDGMVSAWAQRADPATPVLALRDNPFFGETPVTCISDDPSTAAERCALPADHAMIDDGKQRAVAEDPHAQLLDLTPYYCADGMCPAVIGGVVVYRDSHHLTSTYASTLGPYLARELGTALG